MRTKQDRHTSPYDVVGGMEAPLIDCSYLCSALLVIAEDLSNNAGEHSRAIFGIAAGMESILADAEEKRRRHGAAFTRAGSVSSGKAGPVTPTARKGGAVMTTKPQAARIDYQAAATRLETMIDALTRYYVADGFKVDRLAGEAAIDYCPRRASGAIGRSPRAEHRCSISSPATGR